MFERILIANRGEIACRVIATARRLGIGTVAVYSEADAAARHVALADEAVCIGPPPARDSYLLADRIVAAAEATGAQAIHPGYGFLAENAGFAGACADAGLVFIGPSPEAIRAMGSKSAAKAVMADAGVPVLPGYHGEEQDDAALATAAAAVGFPLIVKPVAGGGGKGMRVLAGADGLDAELAAARREARSSFGDPALLLERYLARPRHVEVQVFCDAHGNGVHLFERDCSVQRRHQKIIEEAPAPGLDPELRQRFGETAVRAALAIDYLGAGTVEFLLDEDGSFYFMEMNTRLQVEHPVTEMITGLDLVEWQLRVAAGEPLPLRQDEVTLDGHAIELRLCAEDPAQGFLPAIGTIAHLAFPATGDGVRVDTGVRTGDAISEHYDSMVAKLIVHGSDRDAALRRTRAALAGFELIGPKTNRELLWRLLTESDFTGGAVDTGYLDRELDALLADSADETGTVALAAALWLIASRDAERERCSAWDRHSCWRPNLPPVETLSLQDGDGGSIALSLRHDAGGLVATTESGDRSLALLALDGAGLSYSDGGRRCRARVFRHGDEVHVFRAGRHHRLRWVDPHAGDRGDDADAGGLLAPMPGKVLEVLVAEGDAVTRGQPLLILEAMKMEHTVRAPGDGVVEEIRFGPGDTVPSEGLALLRLSSPR